MKNASGEGEQECWFEEGGCIESSEMESGSWRDCCQSGVNLATPVYGDKPGSKFELNCISNNPSEILINRDWEWFQMKWSSVYKNTT